MNFVIVETEEHKDAFKKVVQEHTSISKIDIISTGIKKQCIQLMEQSVLDPKKHLVSWLATDDDGEALGVMTMKLGETIPCWYGKFSFTSAIGNKRYGVNMMFYKGWEYGFAYAENRGYYELYYSQRIGRYRLMEQMMSTAPFLKNYKIDLVEQVPPYSHSVNPLIRNFIHGQASGLNPKTLCIARIYNPDKVKYEYPYPPAN